jgi:hypothetical protein
MSLEDMLDGLRASMYSLFGGLQKILHRLSKSHSRRLKGLEAWKGTEEMSEFAHLLGGGAEDVHKGAILGIQEFLKKANKHIEDCDPRGVATCYRHAAFLLWGLGALYDEKANSDEEWAKVIEKWEDWSSYAAIARKTPKE